MKTRIIIIAACLAAGGAGATQTSSPGQDQVLTRISNQTGVPVDTLRQQEAKTGLGFGDLEKANLLAKASGHSFQQVVSRFKAGEGWGEIAHDAGLNLGKIESEAHRSDNAAQRGHDAEAREDGDRDDRGDRDEARDDRDRDARGDGEKAREDGDRDGRGHDAAAQGHHRVLTRISNQTGVPVHTLRKQEAKTGLGFGGLEKANLLAKATGRSFQRVVSRFRSGEGWGKIAHDAGLKQGKLVSRAHRSDNAAQNARIAHPQSAHGKSLVAQGRSAVAHGNNAVAHGNNSFQSASAVSHGRGTIGTMNGSMGLKNMGMVSGNIGSMNGIGHSSGSATMRGGGGGAVHGMGHGHGGR